MKTTDYYHLNHSTSFLIGDRNKYGELYTRLVEENRGTLITMTPRAVIDHTLTSVGSDLKAATKSARKIIGKKSMCPIIVNPYQDLCLFPTTSPSNDTCIWFNPKHIIDTVANGKQTKVILKSGLIIIVNIGKAAFDNKWHAALKLLKLTKKNGLRITGVHYEYHKNHLIIREVNGVYNFDPLKKMNNNMDTSLHNSH